MILKDCFYSLLETTSDAQGNYVCKVRLNASHEIYQAHFQGNPITPGACIVQMTKELSEEITTKRLQITQIKNLKFIKIIIPHEYPEIYFQVSLKQNEENNSYNSKVLVFNGEVVFAKISLNFSIINS